MQVFFFFGRVISRFQEFITVWYGESPMLRQLKYVHKHLSNHSNTY
jgi:hypothetical protein